MIRFEHVVLVCMMIGIGLAALGCAAQPVTLPTVAPSATAAAKIAFSTPTVPPVRMTTPTKTPVPSLKPSTPTPGPHVFDDVDSLAILTALYPNYEFAPSGDMFVVNGNPKWMTWVNSRAEGHFTDLGGFELAVIIATEFPNEALARDENTPPWGSFLAVLTRNGHLQVVHRDYLFPVSISPLSFDVKIERVMDYDHDDQDDLLVTTTSTRFGFTTKADFLYQWDDKAFSEVWSMSLGEDNTAALNQSEYYATTSDLTFADLDSSGIDAIIVDTTRVDYALGSQGLADLDHEKARRVERRVYRWIGKGYALDPARATPMSPIPSPTP